MQNYKCMLGKGHRDTDGRRAPDGEIDGQKPTEVDDVNQGDGKEW